MCYFAHFLCANAHSFQTQNKHNKLIIKILYHLARFLLYNHWHT